MTPKEKMERLMAPKELSDYAITISLSEIDRLINEEQREFWSFFNAGCDMLPPELQK